MHLPHPTRFRPWKEDGSIIEPDEDSTIHKSNKHDLRWKVNSFVDLKKVVSVWLAVNQTIVHRSPEATERPADELHGAWGPQRNVGRGSMVSITVIKACSSAAL